MAATASASSKPSLADMAAATPASRDRYVDFIRAMSIAVVVFGHWLMAIIYFDGDVFRGESALAVIPGLWLATWVLQVMPLFFFVGGFSNAVTLDAGRRRGESYTSFLNGRVARLMRPTAIFIGAWMGVALAIELFAGDRGKTLLELSSNIARPLWFLGVYVIAVALAPPMQRLHQRFGIKVPIALAAGAALVDLARLGLEVPFVGYLNFAFVWLFAHQLGFFYADGALVRASRKTLSALTGAGLLGLVVLTNIGVYSPSMVGMPGTGASNNDPPSVCLIALTMWLVGVAMLARGRVSAWLQRPKAWAGVIGANTVIMTVYLWHLTALLVAVLTLYPIGFPQPAGGTAQWWATRPAWIAILCALLAGFVAIFGRFERPRTTPKKVEHRSGRGAGFAAGTGMALLVLAISGFALTGFAGIFEPPGVRLIAWNVSPAMNLVLLGAGIGLLKAAAGGGSSGGMIK